MNLYKKKRIQYEDNYKNSNQETYNIKTNKEVYKT